MSGLSATERECFAAVDRMVPGSDLVSIAEDIARRAREAGAAEVRARVEAVITRWPLVDNGQEYRRGVIQAAAAIRAALDGGE